MPLPKKRLPLVLPAVLALSCVPPGNAVPEEAGAPAPSAPAFVPSVGIMVEPFFDDFERKPRAADAVSGAPATRAPQTEAGTRQDGSASRYAVKDLARDARAGKDGGPAAPELEPHAPSRDPADPPKAPPDTSGLGPDWTQSRTTAWRVENGWLCGQGAHNHGVWLNRILPVNARIEFDARSEGPDGDLKAEVWGDGQSSATSVSYTNATSYLTILGGWKNTIHVLARINEHGTDRKELHVDKESDDARKRPVAQGQIYHFKIERSDGKTVRWSVNGAEMLSFFDTHPLAGMGHDHFGFNEWETKVCYDNVRVTPLR